MCGKGNGLGYISSQLKRNTTCENQYVVYVERKQPEAECTEIRRRKVLEYEPPLILMQRRPRPATARLGPRERHFNKKKRFESIYVHQNPVPESKNPKLGQPGFSVQQRSFRTEQTEIAVANGGFKPIFPVFTVLESIHHHDNKLT